MANNPSVRFVNQQNPSFVGPPYDPSGDEEDNDEDDDEEEEGPQPGINPNAAPTSLAVPQMETLRNQLYSELEQRLHAKENPQAAEPLIQGNKLAAGAIDRNALYTALAQSAAQAGTIGGKQANTLPVETMAKAGDQSAMLGYGGLVQQAQQGERDREQLYQYLAQQANLEFMAKRYEQMGQYQAGALAERVRHDVESENNRSQALNDLSSYRSAKLAPDQAPAAPTPDASAPGTSPAPTGGLTGAAPPAIDKATEAQFEKFGDKLTGTVRSTLGNEKRKLTNATHAMALLDRPDLSTMTPLEVQELSSALAGQMAQGSPGEQLISKTTPKTLTSDLAQVYQYVTGKPAPANQAEFAGLFKNMLARQMQTSQGIVQGELAPIIANYAHLRNADPTRFDGILRGAGITMDQGGNLTAYEPSYMKNSPKGAPATAPQSGTAMAAPSGIPATQHPQAGQAKEWAMAHLGTPYSPAVIASAHEILRRLGVEK